MADTTQVTAAIRRLRSGSVSMAFAGLKAVADANGMPQDGRALQFGVKGHPNALVLRHAPSHPNVKVYQAAQAALEQEMWPKVRRKKPQIDLLQRQRRLGLAAARQQRKRFLQQLLDQREERGAK